MEAERLDPGWSVARRQRLAAAVAPAIGVVVAALLWFVLGLSLWDGFAYWAVIVGVFLGPMVAVISSAIGLRLRGSLPRRVLEGAVAYSAVFGVTLVIGLLAG